MAGARVRVEFRRSKALKTVEQKALLEAAQRVERRAKELCSNKTVAASITVSVNAASISVGSPLPMAEWLEHGTGIYGPHHTPIVPVNSKVLVFPSKTGQGMQFATHVEGQPAKPFLKPALEAVRH